DRRAEAFEIFFIPGRGNRRQRSPVECALERDDAETLGLAAGKLIFARHLDRAFNRLGAGILEKYRVGKAQAEQPVRQPLAFGNSVQVRDVPDFLRLILERAHQPRMGMSKSINCDAGGEIEVALTVSGE